VAGRRFRPLSIPLLLAVLLTACAGDGQVARTRLPAEADGTAAAAVAGPAAAAPQEAALPTPPALPRIAVKEVLGFSRNDLVAAFGAPAFSRVDKGAEILRFRGEGCVLDVFLYKDRAGGPARVAHFEARDAAGKAADREACVNATPRARG